MLTLFNGNKQTMRNTSVRSEWRRYIKSKNFNTLATIQAPMKHKYIFDSRMKTLSNMPRIKDMFYSVEKNVDGMGYHIHLLINTYNTTRDELAWALNIKPSYVPYYEEVDSQVGVSNYVTKMMKGDQIHYNLY